MKRVLRLLVVVVGAISMMGLSSCDKDKGISDKGEAFETLLGTQWEYQKENFHVILSFITSTEVNIISDYIGDDYEPYQATEKYSYSAPLVIMEDEGEEQKGKVKGNELIFKDPSSEEAMVFKYIDEETIRSLVGTVWEHKDGEDFMKLSFISSTDVKIESSYYDEKPILKYSYNPPIVRVKEDGKEDQVLEVSGNTMTHTEVYEGEEYKTVFTKIK